MGTAVKTYSMDQIVPSRNRDLAIERAILLKVSTSFAKGAILAEKTGTNEIQTVTLGGTGAGSHFTLTFGAVTSGSITWSATNATLLANIQAALDAMSNIGPGNTLVATSTLSSGIGDFLVTFQNYLGSTNVAQMTAAIVDGSLTASVATSTAGVVGSNGTFEAYNSGGSDGTQVAKCILPVACTTDASGNITLGDSGATTGGDEGTTFRSIWAWFGGYFFSADVPALTTGILTSLGGKFVEGNLVQRGEFKF